MDKIVREFIPDDYYKSLDNDQKRNILRIVIINTIREFTKAVIDEFLFAIIDNHEEQANIEAMKERIIDLFIDEREKMFHKFLDSHSAACNEKVDRNFAEKMKAEILKLNEEKLQLVILARKQKEEIEVRKEQLTKVLGKYRKIESNYKNVLAEYNISKEKADELEEQNRIVMEEVAARRKENEKRNGYDEDEDDKDDDDEINSAFIDNEPIKVLKEPVKALKEQDKTQVKTQDKTPVKAPVKTQKEPLKPVVKTNVKEPTKPVVKESAKTVVKTTKEVIKAKECRI
jgi:hypothetical protein